MKRERKRRRRTIQRVGESFSDGGEEFKARRLCNRSGDRAMEQAVSHPLKRKSGVGDAVSEKVEAGKFFDANDAYADENGGLAGVIGDGNFDGRVLFVTMAALKTEAAFGNLDDVFTGGAEPDAGDEIDASADVAPQIEFAAS